MPVRLCAEPTCPELAVKKGRCREHLIEQRRTNRPTGYLLYRTKRWAILSRRVKFEQPICATEGCDRLTTDVDHIVPLSEGGALWSRSNLQGLCGYCHGIKTAEERR